MFLIWNARNFLYNFNSIFVNVTVKQNVALLGMVLILNKLYKNQNNIKAQVILISRKLWESAKLLWKQRSLGLN